MNWFKPMGIAIAFGAVCVGCASMALKSDNAAERMAAVKEITDQSDLLDVALNKEYQNDIRLDAIKRLKKQRNLWRVWCENGENKAISDESLKLLTDEMLLARVALLHSYEESADEKEARQSSETKKAWGVGLAAAAVNVGGAAADSKAGGAGGALAARTGTAAANIGLAMAIKDDVVVAPAMATRTNDALIAVGKIKQPELLSRVAILSGVSAVAVEAFCKFATETKDAIALTDMAIHGRLTKVPSPKKDSVESVSIKASLTKEEELKVKLCAAEKISDVAALKEVAKDCEDGVAKIIVKKIEDPVTLTELAASSGAASKFAFATLLGRKNEMAIADVLAQKEAHSFFAKKISKSGGLQEDVTERVAEQIISRISDDKALAKIAQTAKSFSLRVKAVEKLKSQDALCAIALNVKDCPYDTEHPEMSLFDNSIKWMWKVKAASAVKLQKIAIAHLSDADALRKVSKQIKDKRISDAVSARMNELGISFVSDVLLATQYDENLFSMFEGLKKKSDLERVAKEAKLKGLRLMAAPKVGDELLKAVLEEIGASIKSMPAEGHMALGGFHLGMDIEDMLAKLAAEFPDVKPTLYLGDGVLCIAGASGRDIAWANDDTLTVHWIALPPSVVKQVVGFKTGSFEDLKRAVEKKLGVSFGYDVIRKGNVSQKIGNLENTEGETLRYFTGEIGEGEDFGRSVRKAINQHTIDTNPLNGGFGAALANAFEDAQQADENRANAQRPMFQPQGSLQLLFTKNAAKGTIGAKGSFNKNTTLGAALQAVGELGQKMEELKGAKKELGDAWSGMKSEVKKEMRGAVGEENVKDLKKSMDELKAAADALKNLGK